MSGAPAWRSKARVWLLQRSDVVGGTKTIIDGLERRLVALGVDASAVYLRDLREHEEARGARWARPVVATRDLGRLLRRLRLERPAVIVTFTPFLGAVAALAARYPTRSRVVSTLHAASDRVGRGALRLDATVARLGWYARIVACAPSVAASYARNGPAYMRHVTVIANGVEPSYAPRLSGSDGPRAGLGLPAGGKVAVAVGRLTAGKNYGVLLEALALAPDWRLVVLGGGEARAELEARAHALGVVERVRFLGRVPREQVGGWLSACDAFVQPSLHEGLSLALLEAMAHGAPVLVSDIPANRDPVAAPGGDVGWLLPGGDPRAWAAALTAVAADPATAEAVGELARDRQRSEFDQEAMYGRYVAVVLEELASQ